MKKLLGFSLSVHDSSISYFDGQQLHYYKQERALQDKHRRINNIQEVEEIIGCTWGITLGDMDDIAFVCDNHDEYYGLAYEAPGMQRIDHHLAHHLSCGIVAHSEPDGGIVIDAEGETNITWSVFRGHNCVKQGTIDELGSVGYLMQDIGKMLLVDEHTHEQDIAGKVMGAQSYGKINTEILSEIQHCRIHTGIGQMFESLVRHQHTVDPNDIMKTLHYQLGNVIVEFFEDHFAPEDVIYYTGGVAQNVIWNTQLRQRFPGLVVPPHCSDEGLSIGCVEYLKKKHLIPREPVVNFPFVCESQKPFTEPDVDTIKQAAQLLSENKIIGWYQGHAEVGPRALGNRSILMNPTLENGKDIINTIKNREHYRPFGGVVLDEFKQDYFVCDRDFDNPYMLYVADVKDPRLKLITHVDGTCRIQTLKDQNPTLRRLLLEFYRLTGCAVLLNTSFNVAGKPIATHKADAIHLLNNSKLDHVFIGNMLYTSGNILYEK